MRGGMTLLLRTPRKAIYPRAHPDGASTYSCRIRVEHNNRILDDGVVPLREEPLVVFGEHHLQTNSAGDQHEVRHS